jgi:hypothetical protein
MKVKTGQASAISFTSSDCLDLGRKLFKIDCGFAFTRFVTSPERRKSLDIKAVPISDILSGLQTVVHTAKYMEGNYRLLRPDLGKRLKSVESAANRIANQVKKSGLKAYGGKELDSLIADVEKSSKRHLDALRKAAEEVCVQSIATPKKKGRAS